MDQRTKALASADHDFHQVEERERHEVGRQIETLRRQAEQAGQRASDARQRLADTVKRGCSSDTIDLDDPAQIADLVHGMTRAERQTAEAIERHFKAMRAAKDEQRQLQQQIAEHQQRHQQNIDDARRRLKAARKQAKSRLDEVDALLVEVADALQKLRENLGDDPVALIKEVNQLEPLGAGKLSQRASQAIELLRELQSQLQRESLPRRYTELAAEREQSREAAAQQRLEQREAEREQLRERLTSG
jgi:hypothetical protein